MGGQAIGGARGVRVGSWAYALVALLLAIALVLPLARLNAFDRRFELRTSDLAVVWWWTLVAAGVSGVCAIGFRRPRPWYAYLLPLLGSLLALVFVAVLAFAASSLDRLASAAVGEDVAGARAEIGLWVLGMAAAIGVIATSWELGALIKRSWARRSSARTIAEPVEVPSTLLAPGAVATSSPPGRQDPTSGGPPPRAVRGAAVAGSAPGRTTTTGPPPRRSGSA